MKLRKAYNKFKKTSGFRLVLIVIFTVIILGSYYVGGLIARGGGKDERRVINSIFQLITKDNITADISTSQSGGTSAVNINGSVFISERKNIDASLAVSVDQSANKIAASVDAKGAINGQSNLYLKTQGLGSIVNALIGTVPEAKVYANQAVSKINGKWLVINGNSNAQSCFGQLFSKLSNKEDARKAFESQYKKNRFIFVNSSKKDGDGTLISVTIDRKILQKFLKSFEESDLFKSNASCQNTKLASQASQESSQDKTAGAKSNINFLLADDNTPKSVTLEIKSVTGTVHINTEFDYSKSSQISLPQDNLVQSSEIMSDISQMAGALRGLVNQATR